MEEYILLLVEQGGCNSESTGCKNQVLILRETYLRAVRSEKNFNATWIDYQKEFVSVPHKWTEKQRIKGVKNKIFKFSKLSMEKMKHTNSGENKPGVNAI